MPIPLIAGLYPYNLGGRNTLSADHAQRDLG